MHDLISPTLFQQLSFNSGRCVHQKNNEPSWPKKDLQELEIWAKTWGMRFNAKKCYITSINYKSLHVCELDKHILQQIPKNPYLGITISEDLKWITKKANSTLGFLRRNLTPETCRKTAYLALICSFLPICLNLRGGHQTGFGIQVQRGG